jgi:hypothetical protein
LGDETNYLPNQEPETSQDQESSQEPVSQEHSDDLAFKTEMESQVLDNPDLSGLQETYPEAVVSESVAPDVAAAPVDFAEPVDFVEPVDFAEPAVEILAAEPAPLVASASQGGEGDGAGGDSARELLGLPLQFLNQLLQRIGSTKLDSLADLIPAARLVGIALLAGVALKLTGATLGAINDVPLLGGLLELTGLVTMLNFLARNALKQQKRAELLGRIRKLKQDFLG